jgi:ATP-binding cassette subfamily B (MDR/TAP) protein 1
MSRPAATTKSPRNLRKSSRSSSSEGKSVDDKVEFDPYAQFTPAERKILEDQAAVPPLRKVTMGELFRFQTKWEKAFNAAGLLCAIVSGAAQPLMTVVFGSLTTSFTSYFAMVVNGSSPEVLARAKADVTAQTNKNALYLLYIGIGIAVTTYIYEWAFTTSAEKTAKRVRESYYASVMRQNVAYFDKLGAGEVATRIETDCHLVQDGVGDKIPISMSFVSMFFSGFIIAFVRNWLLAIALSCIIPVIGGAGWQHFPMTCCRLIKLIRIPHEPLRNQAAPADAGRGQQGRVARRRGHLVHSNRLCVWEPTTAGRKVRRGERQGAKDGHQDCYWTFGRIGCVLLHFL